MIGVPIRDILFHRMGLARPLSRAFVFLDVMTKAFTILYLPPLSPFFFLIIFDVEGKERKEKAKKFVIIIPQKQVPPVPFRALRRSFKT